MNTRLVDSIVFMVHNLSAEEQTLLHHKLGVPSEIELLQGIYQGVPQKIQQRYDELREKLQEETISPDEHYELIKMIDVIEQYDVDRLEKLVQITKLRNVSLDELMQQLNLKSSTTNV